MLLICAVFVLIHLLLFEFFIIFAPCRALWAVQEAYLELPAPAEEMDERVKNQMEPPGEFNSPPLQILSWEDCETFSANSLWVFQSWFLPFPISSSNHKPFSHCQHFPCEMIWRWWCCWVFALGVVVLGSVWAGCQVGMAELSNCLTLTWRRFSFLCKEGKW